MKHVIGRCVLQFITFLLLQSATPAWAQVTIDTSNASDWKISNSAISLDWNSTTGNVFGLHLNGYSDNLVDTTVTSHGQPRGLYMDNSGVGGGAVTSGYYQSGNQYLDWWITTASGPSNAFTYTQHFIIGPTDSGFHVYFVANHSANDVAGSLGQVQYVFRISQTLFTHTYSVNSGLNNLGANDITLPDPTVLNNADPGRVVQDATLDLHGLNIPEGFGREFYTKYDYSSYEYLHQAHGLYGPTYGAWAVIPRSESLVGGPTKQDLIYTDTILILECLSNHLDNNLSYRAPKGLASSRLFGPYYFHFNAFTAQRSTPGALYQDALAPLPSFDSLYDADSILAQNGYIASSARGSVAPFAFGIDSQQPDDAWIVLSDNATNFQYSTVGREYWTSKNASANASLSGVVPGTYRLSGYVLGQWGELRNDSVTVTANNTTALNLAFAPEDFGTALPIWTIGTPDRSAHEFLHGENSLGQDDREFWGNWNYWKDFQANNGAAIYYATPVGSTPATNDLNQWNYVQWQSFDPGLFAGVYNPSDDTTDGYKYITPAYVGNPATANAPPWQIHFATTAAQQAQGQYAVMSVGLAAAEGSLIVKLNGQQLIWHSTDKSDAMVRSGLAGTYQWVVFQWNSNILNPPGQDNVITLSVNRQQGVMYDALRMEITDRSADHSVTGWNDYEFIYGSTDQLANDSISNNNAQVTAESSNQIAISASGLIYSRVTHTFVGTVTLKNVSGTTITGPFEVVFTSLPSGVSLVNATGTYNGSPYMTVTGVGSLAPDQSAAENVQFADPSNVRINFTPAVYSGSVQ